MNEFVARTGCRPPYIKLNKSVPICNTIEKMKISQYHYQEPDEMDVEGPCRRMSKIKSITPKGKKSDKKMKDWYLSVHYPKEFKIITQSKEVDIHSLIGNIGGYLGLFMGNEIENIIRIGNK